MGKIGFVVCIFLFICSAAFAADPLLIDENFRSRYLGKNLEYLEDPDGTLSYQKIHDPQIAQQFKVGRQDVPNFGVTDSAFWVRFSLQNSSDRPMELLLVGGLSLTHFVDVYIRKEDGSLDHRKSGTTVPIDLREVNHRDHIFRLNLKPLERIDLAMRLQTKGAMIMDLSVWQPESFWRHDRRLTWIVGLAIGGFLILALYHLLLYVSVRDALYLHFVFFLSAYTLYLLSLEGIALQYLWPDSAWWAGHCTTFLAGLAMFAGTLFVRAYFLPLDRYPRLDKAMLFLAVASLAAGLSGFIDYMFGNFVSMIMGALVLTLLPLAMVYQWKKGFLLARNFLIAWVAFFVCAIFFLLTISGTIEAHGSTFMSLAVGFIIGGIVLAFVVGQRINDVMRKYRVDLEERVKDKTASLKETVAALKTEVGERQKAEKELEYRIDLVQVISHISTMFIDLPSSEIDAGIDRALQVIGRFLDVDRSYVFLRGYGKGSLRNTHEWTADGIEPRNARYRNMQIESAPWWMSKLRAMETIYIPDAALLPPEASLEKEALAKQRIRSLLVTPLSHESELIGFLGFDSIREQRTWGGDEIALLDTVGMIIVNATARKSAEEELARYREHLEELVNDRTAELNAANRQLQQDMVERKQAEVEKEKLEEQLRQSQKMEAIGRLAGGIAHDFNNLLTGIIGYTEMILHSIGQIDPLYPDLMEIKLASERAATLTAQLLAFSRKQIIRPVRLDPAEVIARSKNMLARMVGEDIVFYFKAPEQRWFVHADPNQIEQVLINLVINARDAMPSGGRLEVAVQNIELTEPAAFRNEEIPEGEYVRLTIRDNGCGMEPDILDHLFEPFFSTKSKEKGAGLGLATVYGIIKQNQGYVVVESEFGKGSSFVIYLPREIENRSLETNLSEKETPARPITSVLLIADEEMILNFARRVLESEGYRVIFAEDEYDALRICGQADGNIGLLVGDRELSRNGESAVFDRLKTILPSLKALLMTDDDQADRPDQEQFYIRKPFSLEMFTWKIRQIMKGASSSSADPG